MDNQKITKNKNYYCKKIDSKTANTLVRQYHYSGKVVNNSRLHLGIFDNESDELLGALSFGYPMMGEQTTQKLVSNLTKMEMYELNRMAMLDSAPKMSESQALGLAIKWIKKYDTNIKWLLSFSDGKEGNIGIIYQATNWEYYGYKISNNFYVLNSEVIHSITVMHLSNRFKNENEKQKDYILRTYNDVCKIECRQHIYIMPLAKKLNILLNKQPYPKKETEPTITKKTIYKENGKVLDKPKIIKYI